MNSRTEMALLAREPFIDPRLDPARAGSRLIALGQALQSAADRHLALSVDELLTEAAATAIVALEASIAGAEARLDPPRSVWRLNADGVLVREGLP